MSEQATTAGANRRYDIIPWAAQNALDPVIEMESGEGVYFYDTAGKRYLDFSSQLVNVNLGYQHPKVIEAIREQAGRLCYIGPHHTTAARETLGRKLAAVAPGDIQTAFFTGSGSEATEIAMMVARLVTGRRKILAKYRSYHGTTSGSMSASGDPRRLAVGYDHPNIVRFLDPYCHRCPFSLSYPGCGVQCAKSVEEVIEREGPGQIAAVIVEPMTAASGGIKPPPEYFPILREICDRHGILMIADEVICGFGRTGRWFGIEHWDVVPDLMAVSKGITSGYVPMGAVLMRPHVAASFDEDWFPMGSTQTANPLACAAACAALDAYENDGLIENAARMGTVLAAGLGGLKARHACVSDVRSLGLLASIELTADPASDAPFSTAPNHRALNETMKRRLLEHGLEARICLNGLLIGPPLCIDADQIGDAIGILDTILDEVDAALG